MDDCVRTHLVTKFKCTKCGTMLKLSYKKQNGSNYTDGEPTGAAMVGMVVGVHPCEGCFAAAEKLKKAVAVLVGDN